MEHSKKEFLPVGHDSDFESDVDDRKSTSEYVFTQSTTADSTIEAEYIAASDTTKKVIWMKKFITELGVVPSIVTSHFIL
ncbi:hypothetical protein L3X38_004460 [Prunus dulcis]|uniref:Transposable element protein n=1 Tax=Prunus dulcis TaxID=3755 RepID=A0AAD4ZP21_PRUDU|nr:hypothetical protein L3X38_004460 [Prunus dulcis]